MSPFDRLMYEMSNRISSAELFSSLIVILSSENWIDWIVSVWVCFVVWARKIRNKIPRRDRMKVIF